MKKFLKIFLGLVVLGILTYYGYSSYKKSASLIGVIHKEADFAFKIGIQDIKETLVWDAITAPKYYFDAIPPSKDDGKDDDKEEPGSGIDLQPFNLVGFTVSEVKNTIFSILPIDNSKDFEIFIEKELATKADQIKEVNKGYKFAVLKGNKIALAWNSKRIIAAIALEIPLSSVQVVFSDVLVDEKIITNKEHPLIKILAENASHAVFTDGKGISLLNFLDGKAVLDGKISTAITYPKETTFMEAEDSSLRLYFNADFELTKQKNKLIESLSDFSFFDKNNLDVAQIVNRTNGFFSASISGRTMQKDTIITYGYDDNFEKVEQKSIQEKEVPKVRFNLGSAEDSLPGYLSSVGALNNQTIFKPFPLYQLYVKEAGLVTSFSTFNKSENVQKKINTSFFNSQVNFKRLQEDLNIPQTAPYFELLTTMQVQASQAEGKQVLLQGELVGKEPNINILSQVFLGLQNTKTVKPEADL